MGWSLWVWTTEAPAAMHRNASAASSSGARGAAGFVSGVVTPLSATSRMTGWAIREA